MVKSVLKKKLLRDIKGSFSQFISIIVMLILGVGVFIGLDSTWRSLDEYTDSISRRDNIADFRLYSESFSEDDLLKVSQIEGVKEVQKRLAFKANVPEYEAQLEVSVTESDKINKLNIRNGASNLKSGESILDLNFAEENGIKVGDYITLSYNKKQITLKVAGLATSASYIYTVPNATSVIPNHKEYGFIQVTPQDVKKIIGEVFFNEVLVTTNKEVNNQKIKEEIRGVLSNKLKGIIEKEETLNYLAIQQKITQYKSIGNIFPLIFFAVVILMTFTTMIRLMNNQRKQIGLLKALGYNSRQIILHYMSYGIWISIIGCLLGLFVGWKVVPQSVWELFEELFVLPDAQIILYWPKVILILIVSILSTVIPTIYVYLKTEVEQPAELIRTKISKKSGNILLESFPFVWEKLSTTKKLISRQIFSNKIRLFMTLFGVLGSTTLLITALGMKDTIENVASSVYEETYLYETKIYLKENIDFEELRTLLDNNNDERIMEVVTEVSSKNKTKMTNLHVLENSGEYIQFYDENEKKIPLDNGRVLVTQKTADIYKVNVGDDLTLKLNSGNSIILKVTDISKVNIGQGIYLSESTWKDLNGKFIPTALLSKQEKNEYSDNVVSHKVKTSLQEKDFTTSMSSTLSMAVLMIAAAAILAFLVLYNLGMLNFAERERDLATLLVLGFYQKELKSFISFENILFSILGIILGILGGHYLHSKIFESAGMGDELDFSIIIEKSSICIAVFFVLLIVIIVNLTVISKIKKIHMAEALKSVE